MTLKGETSGGDISSSGIVGFMEMVYLASLTLENIFG